MTRSGKGLCYTKFEKKETPKKVMKTRTIDKYQLAPTWDAKHNGVYVPLLNITIQAYNLRDECDNIELTWNKAKQLAEAAGGRLFTKEEAYILLYQKEEINAILKEHNGNLLDSVTWSSTEYKEERAWLINFFLDDFWGERKSDLDLARAVVDIHEKDTF